MTPQERQLVDQLFDRLARLEHGPRDAEAERVIADGLAQAPNAVYALVQTVLVQEEALKRADARIRELSGEDDGAREAGGGFLDTMRNALGGGSGRGSVPSVRADAPNDARWNTGGALASAAPAAQGAQGATPGQGGSFLGTAAASAAGMVGGALLFSSISSLLGSKNAAAGEQSSAASPWGSDNAAGSDLARDAGTRDIGNDRSAGLFDDGNADFAELDDGDFGDFGDVG
ncbi:MAG: DUF2076 domain-containing protein [Pseudolabrys sp.]|nr:DUF2076 domain-containing protein [Pseudolabrys sp.]